MPEKDYCEHCGQVYWLCICEPDKTETAYSEFTIGSLAVIRQLTRSANKHEG